MNDYTKTEDKTRIEGVKKMGILPMDVRLYRAFTGERGQRVHGTRKVLCRALETLVKREKVAESCT